MIRAVVRKVDDNQPEIVKAFRQLGWSVFIMSQLGKGAPDIAVGKFGHTTLVEIKDGRKPPSARKLTDDELQFWKDWNGSLILIESVEDVIAFDRKRSKR